MNIKQPVEPCIIKSKRLVIRPHRDDDAHILNQAILDSYEGLHQWMDWASSPQTMQQTKDYIEYSKICWTQENPSELPLLILDSQEKNIIGSSGFNEINWVIPRFEIGYWGNIHFSGRGLITEATHLLTEYAFKTWNAKRIAIRCDIENEKSCAIPKRLGYALEACLKNERIQPGNNKVSDTLIFVFYNEDKFFK